MTSVEVTSFMKLPVSLADFERYIKEARSALLRSAHIGEPNRRVRPIFLYPTCENVIRSSHRLLGQLEGLTRLTWIWKAGTAESSGRYVA